MTAACASSGPHGATSPLAKLSGLVWPGHGQLGVPHAHGLPAYPPHDLQSPRQRSARHPAWADHEWDVFNRDVAPEPPRWALTGGVGEMRRDAGIAGLPAPSLPSMDPNNAWAAEFDTYSNVSSGPSVRGPPETRRLVGVPVVDDAAWSAEFAAAEMAAGYREFFEEDDDEYSQEWSPEALTEQAKRQHAEFSSLWANAQQPRFGQAVENIPAGSGHRSDGGRTDKGPTEDHGYVQLTNCLFGKLGAHLREISMGRPQVLAPLGPVETGPWRFGGVLGQGGRRASTKAFARFTSEWDHAAELLDEADRLLSLSGDADVRREARMFVAGDWDWERIFKGTTDSATAAEESADERANSALRRLRLLLSHVNAELLRADSSKKTGPTGPEPGAMEELRKHAMEGELMDYGRLQRDLARWSGAEALHDGDIDRRGTPDSFDSANFV